MRLSANLGFLFTDLPLAARVHAAQTAGFDAVEFHDIPDAALDAVAQAVRATGLRVEALNTFMGPSMGRAALDASAFVQDFAQAEAAAARLDARAIHVTAGLGGDAQSYRASLAHALGASARVILIEPICPQAAPGYHLARLAQAEAMLDALAHPQLRLMFDWYHIATELGAKGALAALVRLGARIGHVQLAETGARRAPLPMTLPELPQIFDVLRGQGHDVVGLEYRADDAPAALVAALRAL